MNCTETSPNTPARACNDQSILSPSSLNVSSLDLGLELFTTPIGNKIATPTSPPALCNDRKRSRRHCPFQDQQACSKFLLPKFDDDDDDDKVNVKPLKYRLVQRLTPPTTFKAEGRELFMTPIANKITPATAPPALCRDRKRNRQCAFQDQELCSKFLLPKFDEDDNEDNKTNIGNSAFKFQLVQRLSHPVTLQEEDEKNMLAPCVPLRNETESRPLSRSQSRSDKMYGVNSNNLSIATLPRLNGLKRQSSRTALTA